MKKSIVVLNAFLVMTSVLAQKEKFDIASFTAPAGWERREANGTLSFMHTEKLIGATNFCQIVLYPSNPSNASADKNFKNAWQNLVSIPTKSKAKPTTQTEKSPDGWTLVVGSANVINQGLRYKTIVTNITGFNKTMSVQVNTAGGDYVDELDKFFNEFDVDSKATVSNNLSNQTAMSLRDYEFIAPENWRVRNNADHISIQNMKSGCLVNILVPQASSGNLEQDATAVFEMMYKGWNYQHRGERSYLLVNGILPKGQEYFIKEAAMTGYSADGRYNLEEGTAMVVRAGNQVVIISARHNSAMTAHDECYKNYNTWRRFFNSFAVKKATPVKNVEPASERIVGLWKIVSTGVVSADYVFAANGNYDHGGGIGSSTTTTDMYYEYIYNRAYPYQGSGSYSISEDQLYLKKRGGAAEQIRFRFEKVNHGGTRWKDRIWLLKKTEFGDNESLYEKEVR